MVVRACESHLGVTIVETGETVFCQCELEAEHYGTPHRAYVPGEAAAREWTTPELPVGWPRDTLPEPELDDHPVLDVPYVVDQWERP